MTGGEQRSFHLLKALSRTFDILSVVPTYDTARFEDVFLTPNFREVRFPKTPAYRSVSQGLKRAGVNMHANSLAYALAGVSDEAMTDFIASVWDDVSGVILQHAAAVGVLDALGLDSKPVFYLSHNCEFELASNEARSTQNHEFAALMLQFEYRACQYSRSVFPVSGEDKDKYVHLFGVEPERVEVIGNGSVDRNKGELRPPESSHSAMFIGSRWGPNAEAARYIIQTLAPACPDIHFSIVGSVCQALAEEKAPVNVEMCGILPENALGELMARTHIGLNPILSGGGSNVKLADYLAHGLRVVSTLKGVRGFTTPLENVHVVAEKDFPDALTAFAEAGAPDAETRKQWRAASEPVWSWDALGEVMNERIVQELAETEKPRGQRLKRLMVFNEFPVRGHDSGGEARIAGLLSKPPEDMLVTILSFGRGQFALNRLSDRVVCIELPVTDKQKKHVNQFNKYAYTSSDDIIYPATSNLNGVFLATADCVAAHADALLIEHPFMWPVYKQLRSRVPVAFGSHNVEALMKPQTLDAHARKEELCARVSEWELELTRHAKIILACSQQDADVYSRWGGQAVEVIPNGVTPLEEQGGELDPTEDRKVWMRSELSFSADEAHRLYDILLGRPASVEEGKAAAAAAKKGGPAYDAFILDIMRSEENLSGRRSYVAGFDADALGRPFAAVFLGTSHRPNLSAAQVIVSHIAPRCPDVDFIIAGKVGMSLHEKSFADNVFVTGFLSDAVKTVLLKSCDLGLNPMTEGGGSNLKIPDYIVHGLEVVSTPFGARGFELSPEDGLHRAELLEFDQAINALHARSVTSRGEVNDAVSRYHWSNLSKTYFDLIVKHCELSDPGSSVVVQDLSFLDGAMTSTMKRDLQTIADAPNVWMLAETEPRLYDGLDAQEHPLEPERLRVFERRREYALHAEGLTGYGLINPRIVSSAAELDTDADAALARRQSSFGAANLISGFSDPLYNGRQVHRFIKPGARIGLDAGVSAIEIVGYALSPCSLRLRANGKTIFAADVHKKFVAHAELDGVDEITIGLTDKNTAATPGRLMLSVENIYVLHNDVSVRLPLFALEQQGESGKLIDTDLFLDGVHRHPLRNQGLPIDLMERAAESFIAGQTHTAVVGSEAYCQSMHDTMASVGVKTAALLDSKVADLSSSDTTALPLALSDWEISLLANGRNRIGYLNRINAGPRPFIILAFNIDSVLAAIADRVTGHLARRYDLLKTIILIPHNLSISAKAAALREHLAASGDRIRLLTPRSAMDKLALTAEAGVALAYRAPKAIRSELVDLNHAFDLNIVRWGGEQTESDDRDLPIVHSINELKHRYWLHASDMDWRPAHDLIYARPPSTRAAALKNGFAQTLLGGSQS